MGDARRARCRRCGRHRDEVGIIGWHGNCIECGLERQEANHRQLRGHSGEWFHHWRRQSAAAVGALLVDDLEKLVQDDDQ